MTPFIESLLWCILQVTLVGALALALCAALRRWSSQAGAVVPAAAMAAVVGLTICAFVPWPNWWRFGPQWFPDKTAQRPRPIAAARDLAQPATHAPAPAADFRGFDEEPTAAN